MSNPKSMIRLRMSQADAHYGGNLVDGARMLQLLWQQSFSLSKMVTKVSFVPMTTWSF